jgi:hypothetical protein
MVKRSSSKRAYKKRRTVRKSRVIRRRKTTHKRKHNHKTQRGGGFTYGSSGPSFSSMASFGAGLMKSAGSSILNSATASGREFFEQQANQLKDKLSSFSSPTTAEIAALALGGFVTTLINISKMMLYIGTYIYIAKLMISNPVVAKEIFDSKKQEMQAKYPEMVKCFEDAFRTLPPTDSQAQAEPILPEKEESIIDEFVRRIGEFRQSQSKSQFVKGIVDKFIQKKRADIESLKDNQKTKGIYDCLKAALNKVDKTKDEMGAEVEATPIDDSKLDEAQAAAQVAAPVAAPVSAPSVNRMLTDKEITEWKASQTKTPVNLHSGSVASNPITFTSNDAAAAWKARNAPKPSNDSKPWWDRS